MADKHEIIVDDEVREELQSVIHGEQLGLFSLDFGQGDGHSLEIEEVDLFILCDQKKVVLLEDHIYNFRGILLALLQYCLRSSGRPFHFFEVNIAA